MSDTANNELAIDTTVTLDIRDGHPNDDDWIPVTSSNATRYFYKFIGGNHPHNNGHVQHKTDKVRRTVTLRFPPRIDDRYEFDRTFFIFDDDNQLSCPSGDKKTTTIHNECTKEMDAHYGVRVRDLQEGVTLLCDPAIKNVKV
ncbi:MAG: hypothetical protein ABIU96_00885 [Rhodanobacter sp.]